MRQTAVNIPNIERFCQANKCVFSIGGVGFGRPCVGITGPDSGNYLDLSILDENYETVAQCTADPAPDAYHKHDCLAVLRSDDTQEAIDTATLQLEGWVGRIEERGYCLRSVPTSKNSLSRLMGVTSQLALVDKP